MSTLGLRCALGAGPSGLDDTGPQVLPWERRNKSPLGGKSPLAEVVLPPCLRPAAKTGGSRGRVPRLATEGPPVASVAGAERRTSSYGYARRCYAVHATRLSEVQGAAGIMLKDHNVVTVPAASLRAERPGRPGMFARTK